MDASERQAPRLFDEVRRRMRLHHYSLRTERAYLGWIRRFILANGRRHPRTMGAVEGERFLTTLAVEGGVAASTQNQALSALLFLYRQVLGIRLPWMDEVVRAKRPARVPTVLSRREVAALLAGMDGRAGVVARLLYGTGMRLMEGLRLRVKDVDFIRNEIVVRDGKGGRDRRTVLPATLAGPLQAELERARVLHRGDLEDGFGAVWLPHALARKYPSAAREFGWQYVFPALRRSRDPRDGVVRRHHLDDAVVWRDPQGAAAGSMALLSIMPEAAAAEIIRANAERYVSHPAVRPLDAELVTRQVAEARARGYAVNMGYYFPGEGGLGLPIRRRHHYEVDVAVSFNAPLELMTEEWIASIIEELRNCLGREILGTHQQQV